MNTHDEHLIARDTALPGLRSVLDPNAFAGMLRANDVPFEVRDAAMTYIRYKPGQSCLVGYEIRTDDGTLPVYTKAYRLDEREKLAKASMRFSEAGKSERGGFVDGARFLLTTFYPHDARLRAMRRLKTAGDQGHLLRDLFGGTSPWAGGRIETIRYKPERRFVGRLDVDGVPEAVVKFYTETAFEGLVARSTAFHDAGPLRLTPLVGRSDRYNGLAFAWMPGARLTESLLDGGADPWTAHQVGLSLALMHGQAGDGLPVRTPQDEHNHLASVADSLTFLLPEHAGYIQDVVDRIRTGLSRQAGAPCPTHGDFYAKQVLVDGDTIQLLDFDESALDNPMIDVGNFVAHLHRDRMRSGLAEGAMDRYEEAFLEGYRETAGGLAERDWTLYAAAGLLKLAPHPFRFRESDWPERVLEILACADAFAARSTYTAPAAAPRIDAGIPCLEAALDPAQATRALAAVAGPEARVERARLLRHKAGRRALIGYEIRLAPGAQETVTWLGKVRARGLDRGTYDRSVALWEGAFGPRGDAGVAVAEPVGLVPAWNMWLQRKEAGTIASERLLEADGVAVARRIAEALAYLHAHGVAADRTHGVTDELKILSDRLLGMKDERPEWTGRLDAVVAACCAEALALEASPRRPIHRDFYADNVLVDRDRVVLLDLDLYTEGDPALDAGNFIAHLIEQGLRQADDAGWLEAHADAFQAAFLARSPRASKHAVACYTTLALARHIHISTRFPERRRYTHTLLALCEARLGIITTEPRPVAPIEALS
ncbi:MAG: aminoglycoside phosphotransferase family protein [Rhodothermales bacterium]